MPQFDWLIRQGTAEWYAARQGIPTASEFHHIITPAKMQISASRRPYQCRLIAERMLNWQADSLDKIQHIQDGKRNEPYAAVQLEMICEIETIPIGFVKTDDGRWGASPDRVSGVNKDRTSVNTVIEIKGPSIPKQFEYLLLGQNTDYRAQVQGQLLTAEADKAVFYSYSPHTPHYLCETGRDEVFIKALRAALDQFTDELEEMWERAKKLGAYQPFPKLVTPAERDYADNIRRGPYAPPSEADIDALINAPYGEFG